ncbi:uncharacterized protein LOC133337147 [Musca vetustissima]|uniref:uncharacterized protein LOC133337147 n=1 Tax=Musca vetustissima TaxID=27455 RepID=UPI002AB6E5DD|nr:uncharacterized protein LOC133337147 [Musca vetustissima]
MSKLKSKKPRLDIKQTSKEQRQGRNLLDLPPEILEKIIGCVNIWHHNRIRETSKRFREIDDLFVRHEFEKSLNKEIVADPNSYASAVLRSIRQAAEVYLHSEFDSIFCGCILPMLRNSYKNPFRPQVNLVSKFLVHFYNLVEEKIGDPMSQYSRLLYSLTLMRFFKAFDRCTIISSTTLPFHWRVVIELEGPWLGMLWNSKRRTPEEFCRSHLLVILTEMLITNITGKAFKRVWECPSELYVFGNDTSIGKRIPCTLFTITVHGSKKICTLFQSFLGIDGQVFQWPTKWPKDQFTVNLDIECKEATKWGCSKSLHLEFSPFARLSHSEEDIQCGDYNENTIYFGDFP